MAHALFSVQFVSSISHPQLIVSLCVPFVFAYSLSNLAGLRVWVLFRSGPCCAFSLNVYLCSFLLKSSSVSFSLTQSLFFVLSVLLKSLSLRSSLCVYTLWMLHLFSVQTQRLEHRDNTNSAGYNGDVNNLNTWLSYTLIRLESSSSLSLNTIDYKTGLNRSVWL